MQKSDDIQHSVLIVSASEQFDSLVKRSLPQKKIMSLEIKTSGGAARRCILERYYDEVIINGPLPDENGEALAMDITEKCSASVLLVVPKEIYEDVLETVTDSGVLVLPKPSPKGRIDKAVRFLMAGREKLRLLEKKVESLQEKMEELRIIDRVKILLMEKKGMSEDDAHRFIGKTAMDNGISRGRAARRILNDIE